MAKIAGTYTFKINDLVHGCSRTSLAVDLTVQTVNAVHQTNAATAFKIQPNPLSNAVNFSFFMQEKQNFSVRIVDLAGRVVKTIATDVTGAGHFEYKWMADDQNGNAINAGIYFVQLNATTFSQTEKLMVLR
jgi:flagellar hook assembly protein FlgD